MTQTTTDYNACDVSLWMDNDAGTLSEITGSSNSISANWTQSTGSVSTFQGGGWVRAKGGCMKEGTITIVVLGTTAATEGFSLMHDWFFNHSGDLRTVTWYEPDKNIGSHKFSGEAIIQDMTSERPSSASDPVTTSITLKTTGAWTWVTNAT